MNHRHRWWAALIAAAVVGAAIAALAGSTGGARAARHGAMAPAGGAAALYKAIGSPLAGSTGSVHFGCQTTTPAGCYGPDQIRAAYGIQPLLDNGLNGEGRTIVIVDAFVSPSIAADLAPFEATWGLPAPRVPGRRAVRRRPDRPVNDDGWSARRRSTLSGATRSRRSEDILVVAKSSEDADILAATQWVIDHNVGDVLSQSFGEAERCVAPGIARQHQLFARAPAGHHALRLVGRRRGGSVDLRRQFVLQAVEPPATDPSVTGVGGTDLIADGTSGKYQSESVWNESTIFGDAVAGGGGVSVLYFEPELPVARRAQQDADRSRRLVQRRCLPGRDRGVRRLVLPLRRNERGLAAVGGHRGDRGSARARPPRPDEPGPVSDPGLEAALPRRHPPATTPSRI